MNFKEELKLKTEGVEEVIQKYLPKEEGLQKTLLEAMNYSMLAGGKRIRPLLVQETYRMFSGNSRAIEPFMAAIEMIHTGSLIQDDMPCMDNDTLRRGKEATWVRFGEAAAVISGDALFILAFETAGMSLSMNANPKNVAKAMTVLAKKAGINGMIGGQSVDVEKAGKPLNREELQFIYELKTSALLEASMLIGAIMADASNEDLVIIEEIGRKIGTAFQIQDDILDETSTTEALGKPVGSDEKNEKTTYVSLFGIEKAREMVRTLTDEANVLLSNLTGENKFLSELLNAMVEREG